MNPCDSFGLVFGQKFEKPRTRFRFSHSARRGEILIISPDAVTTDPRGINGITGRMPGNVAHGDYKLKVEVDGVGNSNSKWVDVTDPNHHLPSVIKSLNPAAAYPGRTLVINGLNLPQNGMVEWKDSDSADDEHPASRLNFQSGAQSEVKIPQDLPPGKYYVNLSQNGTTVSNAIACTVRAPEYKVRFTKIQCLKRTGGLGEDEIVTNWVVEADGKAWGKNTGEYKGFEDGVEKPYQAQDASVYPIKGDNPAAVRDYLDIATSLYEWDAGDAESASKAISAIGDAGFAIASLFGPIGGIIGGIIEAIAKLIAAIVSLFGGDPDPLGLKILRWKASELQKKTASGSYSDYLDVSDYSAGHPRSYEYLLHYTVNRTEPN